MIGGFRNRLAVIPAAWALVVVGATCVSIRWGVPSRPEQTTISAALPRLDDVAGDLTTMLDPERAIVTVGGVRRMDRPCRITAARDGARYERVLTVSVPVGDEPGLLRDLAARLSPRYEAHIIDWDGKRILTVRADDFIDVRGTVAAPGQIRIRVDTGCRSGGLALFQPGFQEAPSTARAQATEVFATLGLRPATWQADRTTCPGAGQLWTLTGTASGPVPSLAGVLAAARATPDTRTVLERPDTVGLRRGPTALVVSRVPDGATVAVTVGCLS